MTVYTEVFLGKEVLVENEFGEKSKEIVFSDASLFCQEKSVKHTEFYQAMQTGLKAEKIVSVNRYEYHAFMRKAIKRFARVVDIYTLENEDYTIVREFEKDSDQIELTLTRGLENVNA